MVSNDDSDAHTRLPSFEELDAVHGVHYELPPSLDTFYMENGRAQLGYAGTILGDTNAAETVVRGLYRHLALNWHAVRLEDGGSESYAWRALKLRVEAHAHMTAIPTVDGHLTALAANDRTRAVYHAVRGTLWAMRSQLEAADSPIGLYTAIAGLPERQFDVIILHYFLGYTSNRVASIMGITPATVRTYRRQARRHIAAKLGINLDEERE